MNAIGGGKVKVSEIAGRTSFDTAKISQALKKLEAVRIVQKQIPILNEKNKKLIQYAFCDGMFRFWFRFIPGGISAIERNYGDTYFQKAVKPYLHDYMGEVFETICQDYVFQKSMDGNYNELIAMVMVLGMSVSVFANGETPVTTGKYIELTNPSAGHTYTLYQVFTGSFANIDGNDTLGNIVWGSNVTASEGKVNGKTAAETAESITDSEAGARAFAEAFDAYLTGDGVAKTAAAENPATLKWEGLAEGYYIIKDTTATLDEGDERDLVVVQVLDDVTIAAKAGTVEFDKKVKDRNDSEQKPSVYDQWGNTSDYDVDDDVPYQVTIKLPANFSSYEKYSMTVRDKMDAGLSFNNDVVVKIGETIVPTEKYSVKTTGIDAGETFEIVFADVIAIEGAGDNVEFTVTYSAKLTGDNVIYGNPGNKNEAWLTYSNNPVTGQEGGTTPHKTTVTFTYKLEVDKTDGTNPLPGAEFALKKLVKAEDETTSWSTLTLIKNDAGTVFTFDGLDDGRYMIEETTTPAGYNTIDPIYFNVVATHSDTLTQLEVKQADEDGKIVDTDDATAHFNVTLTKTDEKDAGLIDTTVVNNKGSVLPSTGGMGTTLFYIVGGILVAGAAIILIAKRKVNA